MGFLTFDSLTPEARRLLIGLVLLLCVGYSVHSLVFHAQQRRNSSLLRRNADRKSPSPSREKPTPEPENYEIPVPKPYPDWSIETTKPLPYRAFRYGPKYHVTMGLRSIHSDEWIELDNHFPKFHADKVARIRDRREKVIATEPEAYPAAMELLEELAKYLPNRYPTLFRRTPVGIDNLWSGESFNLVQTPLAEDPMAIAAKLVQDDLAIMMERPAAAAATEAEAEAEEAEDAEAAAAAERGGKSKYHLVAGAICLAGFWRLRDKLGMALDEIHTSGDVPHFREKLRSGMASFFRRLRSDQMYARNNYFIQVDDALPWSWSIGAEDAPVVSWSTAEKDRAVEHHHFRSERQTLRRLPRTRAVVFTIRTYFHPVTEIAAEDYVPGRLASAIRSWDGAVANYKGREKYENVLLEYLDNEHRKQLDRGLDMEKEDEVHKYPW